MQEEHLKSVHCIRRQKSLTDSRNAHGDEYKNLTKDIEITEPFQVLSSDISYIRSGEGFEYICQVKDVLSSTVLAECMTDNMKAELVAKTIKQAMKRWRIPAGTIFHSDRGSQYTSKKIMDLLKSYNLQQSFSRIGKPGDNAWSESFFANMKKESVHWRFYKTREEARQAIFEYIEVFYNRVRETPKKFV